MRVNAAESESAHRGGAAHLLSRRSHGSGCVSTRNGEPSSATPLAGLLEIGGRRQRAFAQRRQHLRHAGRSRRRQQMADRRLHGAENALTGSPTICSPQGLQTLKLDRVADRCSGSVALDQVDVAWLPTGFAISGTHGPQLPFAVRSQQTTAHIVGEANTRNHRMNCVAITQCVVESLQQEDAGAFADDEAIGAGVERGAAAGRRQGAELREAHLRVEAVRPRDAAGQHRIGPTGAQFLHRQLERVQRRGARGVERVTAAAEAERLRQHRGGKFRRRRRSTPPLAASRSAPSSRKRPFSANVRPRYVRAISDAFSVGSASRPRTTPTRRRSRLCVTAERNASAPARNVR